MGLRRIFPCSRIGMCLALGASLAVVSPIAAQDGPGGRSQVQADDPLGLGHSDVVAIQVVKPTRARPPVPGGLVTLNVVLTIREGWHIYANPVGVGTFKPTAIVLDSSSPAELLSVEYPEGKPEGSEGEARIFEGKVTIPVRFQLADRLMDEGYLDLAFLIQFQACNDQLCLPPARKRVPVRMEIQPR